MIIGHPRIDGVVKVIFNVIGLIVLPVHFFMEIS